MVKIHRHNPLAQVRQRNALVRVKAEYLVEHSVELLQNGQDGLENALVMQNVVGKNLVAVVDVSYGPRVPCTCDVDK